MNTINISKQKILDNKKMLFAYELKFTDNENNWTGLSENFKATAKLIISSISSKKLNKLLGRKAFAFINVDEVTLLKGILDVLDKDRFIINILKDIELSEEVVSRIIKYKKTGFKLSLENFDSSAKMIKKFGRLFNFIDILKMDVLLSEPENLEKVVHKFKGSRIKILAQNIESKDDLLKYKEMGFDYFQGDFIHKPEVIEIIASVEPAQLIVLQLIKIIKENDSTEQLESFIKKQPDLSFKLVEFFNKTKNFTVPIESLTQVITLMGRDKLLRWLLVYLYAEVSKNSASKTILALAIKRAEKMQAEATDENKNKAYLAGMFSLLSTIFKTDIKELMNHIKMDPDIIPKPIKE